jgi:hypothetical protein
VEFVSDSKRASALESLDHTCFGGPFPTIDAGALVTLNAPALPA